MQPHCSLCMQRVSHGALCVFLIAVWPGGASGQECICLFGRLKHRRCPQPTWKVSHFCGTQGMVIPLSRQTAKRVLLFSTESILGVASVLPPFQWLVDHRDSSAVNGLLLPVLECFGCGRCEWMALPKNETRMLLDTRGL